RALAPRDLGHRRPLQRQPPRRPLPGPRIERHGYPTDAFRPDLDLGMERTIAHQAATLMNGADYLSDVVERFRDAQKQCDRALAQVPFELWGRRLDPGSNSLVTLMLHLSGNMLSRWTDFLTSDGEKPDRDRDAEFEDPETL